MRVHFLRHGESVSNAAVGAVSLPEEVGDALSPLGRRQAEAAAARLAELPISRVISSTMGRAQETAAIVAGGLGLEVETWDAIQELTEPDFYAGLEPDEQQRQRWSNRMKANADDPHHAPAGGESFADLIDRVDRALERLVAEDVDDTLVVTHGIFKRFIFSRTVWGDDFVPAKIDRLWLIGSLNCGLSTFEHLPPTPERERSLNPADITGWRCVSWMAPMVPPADVTGTGGGGAGT
jgi:broad specificity phosphatase PhoE